MQLLLDLVLSSVFQKRNGSLTRDVTVVPELSHQRLILVQRLRDLDSEVETEYMASRSPGTVTQPGVVVCTESERRVLRWRTSVDDAQSLRQRRRLERPPRAV
jgi:hypothetical protein